MPKDKFKFAIACKFTYEIPPKHLFIFMNSMHQCGKLILGHKHYYEEHLATDYLLHCYICVYDHIQCRVRIIWSDERRPS